ncbi:MAG: hypothetical protein AAB803_01935 [Patescibacteria group bacterium]
MSERVDRIAEKLTTDLPEDLRPFVLSVLHSRIAAHYEALHDYKHTSPAWKANSEFLKQELKNPDKEAVFQRAVILATLPKHQDEKVEWVYRWLRDNGFTMLQEDDMQDQLISLLDDPEKGAPLAQSLDQILSTDVTGVTMDTLSDNPEAFSLFAGILVCRNFYSHDRKAPMSDIRQQLSDKAIERLVDPEVQRVMALFGEISDTSELYRTRFLPWLNWITN